MTGQPKILVYERDNEFLQKQVIKDTVEKFYEFAITAVVLDGWESSVANLENEMITRTQVVVSADEKQVQQLRSNQSPAHKFLQTYVGARERVVSNAPASNRKQKEPFFTINPAPLAGCQPVISSEMQMSIFASPFSDQNLSQSSINQDTE